MAKRKKVSEMTPYERVGRVMHGLSWAEVEEIGMKILGMCIARRMYVLEEDEVKIVDDLIKGSIEKADEFRKDHSMDLAMMHVSEKMARKEEEEEMSLMSPIHNGTYMGGTWELHGRYDYEGERQRN